MLSFLTTWNILSAYVVSLVAFVVVYIVLRTSGFFSGRKCVSKARLAGKTAVITGANTGIGLETALEFARRGVTTLVLGCRCVVRTHSSSNRLMCSFHPSLFSTQGHEEGRRCIDKNPSCQRSNANNCSAQVGLVLSPVCQGFRFKSQGAY